jgi:hypothetical protein
MFVWQDPNDQARVLAYVSAGPAAPGLEVVDVSTPTPTRVVAWDAIRDGGLTSGGNQSSLHSVGVSRDGRTAFLSHQQAGLVLVDTSSIVERAPTPQLAMITPPASALKWPGAVMGPHSAVPAPGRDLLVVTEEIYPMPFSVGCPWGTLHLVDIADASSPVVVGEFGLPENDRATCASFGPMTAFTAHNATVTHDLALVTWYAGGLQAIDISDAAHPHQLAELRPEPVPSVAIEDPALGGSPVGMWSYPIVKDGLIYVVDIRNGLYVVRYTGPYSDQLTARAFFEGNSNIE